MCVSVFAIIVFFCLLVSVNFVVILLLGFHPRHYMKDCKSWTRVCPSLAWLTLYLPLGETIGSFVSSGVSNT